MIDNLITYLNEHTPTILQTLITLELQIVLLGAVVFVVDFFLKDSSPKVRYSIWLIVLLKSFIPPFIELPISSVRTITNISIPQIATSIPVSSIASTQSNATIINASPSLSLLSIILIVWMSVSFLLIALSITRYVVLRWRLRSAEKIDPDSEIKLSESKNIFPDIFKAEKIQTPFAFGFFKPKIFITSSLVHSDAQKLNSVLYHELAHIKRKDGLIAFIQTLAQIIHPFNPMLWFTNIRLYNYREQICDQYAIEHTETKPHEYGEMLLSYMEDKNSNYSRLKPVTCFFETKKGLTQRIKNILNHKEAYMRRFSLMHFILIGGIFLCLIMTSWNCKKESQSMQAQEQRGVTYGETTWDSIIVHDVCDIHPKAKYDYSHLNDRKNDVDLETAMRNQTRASVKVEVQIDESGNAKILNAIPDTTNMLARFAIENVNQYAWTPAYKDGKPVKVHATIPISFFKYTFAPGRSAVSGNELSKEKSKWNYDTPPEPIGGIAAVIQKIKYPEIARRAGIEGDCSADVKVDENGRLVEAVISFSKYEIFEAAALEAVKSVAWKPAMKNRKAVAAVGSVPLKFRIPSPYDVSPR